MFVALTDGAALGLSLLAGLILLGATAGAEAAEADLTWVDARELTVEGKGWTDTAAFYDRLPAKAEGVVTPEVWGLSHNSSGFAVRFRTEARSVRVKWELNSTTLAMPHMPATGVSGVDLYVRRPDGVWRFVGNGRPTAVVNEATFGVSPGQDYTLYLPLYNGVKSVQLGVPAGQTLSPASDAAQRGRPVVFYGTSITQGGCASRPGMAYAAIAGRKLNVPHLNLGFSGAGRMEPAMADLLAELEARVYVLDCLWNMNGELVQERLAPFVRQLRAARPDTPILLAEDCTIWGSVPTSKGKLLREIFAQLQAEGLKHLHFLSAEGMMGPDEEGTVDGCHPTDLGFMYQGQVFAQALAPLVGQ